MKEKRKMKLQTEFSKTNARIKNNYTTIKLHCFRVNKPITFPRVTGMTGWQTVTGVTGMTVSDRIFQINSDQPCHSSHYYLSRGGFETFRFVFTQNTSFIISINKFHLIIIKTLKFVKKSVKVYHEALKSLRRSEWACRYGSGSDRTISWKKPVTVIFAPKNDNVTPCLVYSIMFSKGTACYVQKVNRTLSGSSTGICSYPL